MSASSVARTAKTRESRPFWAVRGHAPHLEQQPERLAVHSARLGEAVIDGVRRSLIRSIIEPCQTGRRPDSPGSEAFTSLIKLSGMPP
jgi:hypothetical protein